MHKAWVPFPAPEKNESQGRMAREDSSAKSTGCSVPTWCLTIIPVLGAWHHRQVLHTGVPTNTRQIIHIKIVSNQAGVWWLTPVIQALGRLKKDCHESETNPDCTVSSMPAWGIVWSPIFFIVFKIKFILSGVGVVRFICHGAHVEVKARSWISSFFPLGGSQESDSDRLADKCLYLLNHFSPSETLSKHTHTCTRRGQQDNSVVKGTYRQIWWPEFNSCDPHNEGNQFSRAVLCPPHLGHGTPMHTQIPMYS